MQTHLYSNYSTPVERMVTATKRMKTKRRKSEQS